MVTLLSLSLILPNILGKKHLSKKSWPIKIKGPKKLCPTSLVKIRSVTAEIFLIWTYVAWTNVTVNIGWLVDLIRHYLLTDVRSVWKAVGDTFSSKC